MYKKSLFNLFIVLTTSSLAGANIYLWENFEGFAPGESLDATGVWVQQGTEPLGIASDALSHPAGGISGYFEQRAGIRHTISEGELPSEFVISAWFYHDASGPPPHYMLVFKGPAGNDWLGVGTVETVENYSIRDKRGTGQETDTGVQRKDWVHIVWQVTQDGTEIFLDGQSVYTSVITGDTWRTAGSFIWFANTWAASGYAYLDSIGIADTLQEIEKSSNLASNPSPADGVLHPATWVNLTWSPGDFAVSHDVYLGDDAADVTAGTAETFRGRQATASLLVGFTGSLYPDGLVPGTTYYWRIDEVNDADPNSPSKGDVWSFSIAPRTAYFPNPADGAGSVALTPSLSWTPGYGAKLHTVYFGDNFDDVNSATGGTLGGTPTYSPAPLASAKVYYWRVDEFDGAATHRGQVWSFATLGAVGDPYPSNGASSAAMNAILTWSPSDNAASHQLYFGVEKEAVRKADTTSPEYKGVRALGAESYDPGLLAWDSTYYWRVDEVNNVNPNSPWKGPLWSFTTGDFLLLDGFESYNDIDPPDPQSRRIFEAWSDGFAAPTTNGALVGNDLPPYTEQTIVHGGKQSMPFIYDNNFKYSEATLTLTGAARDWTRQGVAELSLWFRGVAANAAERMYVALNGNAVVYHEDPAVTQTTGWNEWVIGLQAFADQGVNLANVTSIAIGFGTRGNTTTAGGTGQVYFDDIRLYPPATP